jgi:hypothetical protein
MPSKWELPFGPWLPCNPIDPDPDLIPPAATVPPFWPSHFAPPYLKAPADVSAVPFLELQSIVLVFILSSAFDTWAIDVIVMIIQINDTTAIMVVAIFVFNIKNL